MWETWVQFLGWEDPLEYGKAPVFWPREFHGLYSPWRHKELNTTERLSLSHLESSPSYLPRPGAATTTSCLDSPRCLLWVSLPTLPHHRLFSNLTASYIRARHLLSSGDPSPPPYPRLPSLGSFLPLSHCACYSHCLKPLNILPLPLSHCSCCSHCLERSSPKYPTATPPNPLHLSSDLLSRLP